MNPFTVLGVPPGADPQEVRKAYIEQAKRLHPDTNTSPNAHEAFQQLQEAYAALQQGSSSASSSSSSQAGSGSASADAYYYPPRQEGFSPFSGPRTHTKYGAFFAAEAERRQRAAAAAAAAGHPTPGQAPSFWHLLRQRRAWEYGGVVHRSVHRVGRTLYYAWPVWLVVALAGAQSLLTSMAEPRPSPEAGAPLSDRNMS